MIDRILQQISNPTSNNRNQPKNTSINKNNRTSKYSQSINEYLPNFISNNNAKPVSSRDCVIRLNIWETQSTQEMFDYESKRHVKIRDYIVDEHYDLYVSGMEQQPENQLSGKDSSKHKVQCKLVKPGVYSPNTYCGRIESYKSSQYFLPGSEIDSYRVISHLSDKSSQLKVGSTVKIGRMKYIVQQTFDGKYQQVYKKGLSSSNQTMKELFSLPSGTCKFCLCDQTDNPDLLISPCKCKGSCAQVHVKCLQQWLINKVSRKSTSVVEYLNYDNFTCQLCKVDLPTMLKIDGKMFNMLKQPTEKTEPHLVLQGLPNKKCSTKNNLTITLKICDNKTKLSVGRGHEADVRLEDVSISRLHCFIQFRNNRFYIVDNRSKFGTLILLSPGEKVDISQQKVQIGRVTVEIGDKKMLKAETRKIKQNVF